MSNTAQLEQTSEKNESDDFVLTIKTHLLNEICKTHDEKGVLKKHFESFVNDGSIYHLFEWFRIHRIPLDTTWGYANEIIRVFSRLKGYEVPSRGDSKKKTGKDVEKERVYLCEYESNGSIEPIPVWKMVFAVSKTLIKGSLAIHYKKELYFNLKEKFGEDFLENPFHRKVFLYRDSDFHITGCDVQLKKENILGRRMSEKYLNRDSNLVGAAIAAAYAYLSTNPATSKYAFELVGYLYKSFVNEEKERAKDGGQHQQQQQQRTNGNNNNDNRGGSAQYYNLPTNGGIDLEYFNNLKKRIANQEDLSFEFDNAVKTAQKIFSRISLAIEMKNKDGLEVPDSLERLYSAACSRAVCPYPVKTSDRKSSIFGEDMDQMAWDYMPLEPIGIKTLYQNLNKNTETTTEASRLKEFVEDSNSKEMCVAFRFEKRYTLALRQGLDLAMSSLPTITYKSEGFFLCNDSASANPEHASYLVINLRLFLCLKYALYSTCFERPERFPHRILMYPVLVQMIHRDPFLSMARNGVEENMVHKAAIYSSLRCIASWIVQERKGKKEEDGYEYAASDLLMMPTDPLFGNYKMFPALLALWESPWMLQYEVKEGIRFYKNLNRLKNNNTINNNGSTANLNSRQQRTAEEAALEFRRRTTGLDPPVPTNIDENMDLEETNNNNNNKDNSRYQKPTREVNTPPHPHSACSSSFAERLSQHRGVYRCEMHSTPTRINTLRGHITADFKKVSIPLPEECAHYLNERVGESQELGAPITHSWIMDTYGDNLDEAREIAELSFGVDLPSYSDSNQQDQSDWDSESLNSGSRFSVCTEEENSRYESEMEGLLSILVTFMKMRCLKEIRYDKFVYLHNLVMGTNDVTFEMGEDEEEGYKRLGEKYPEEIANIKDRARFRKNFKTSYPHLYYYLKYAKYSDDPEGELNSNNANNGGGGGGHNVRSRRYVKIQLPKLDRKYNLYRNNSQMNRDTRMKRSQQNIEHIKEHLEHNKESLKGKLPQKKSPYSYMSSSSSKNKKYMKGDPMSRGIATIEDKMLSRGEYTKENGFSGGIGGGDPILSAHDDDYANNINKIEIDMIKEAPWKDIKLESDRTALLNANLYSFLVSGMITPALARCLLRGIRIRSKRERVNILPYSIRNSQKNLRKEKVEPLEQYHQDYLKYFKAPEAFMKNRDPAAYQMWDSKFTGEDLTKKDLMNRYLYHNVHKPLRDDERAYSSQLSATLEFVKVLEFSLFYDVNNSVVVPPPKWLRRNPVEMENESPLVYSLKKPVRRATGPETVSLPKEICQDVLSEIFGDMKGLSNEEIESIIELMKKSTFTTPPRTSTSLQEEENNKSASVTPNTKRKIDMATNRPSQMLKSQTRDSDVILVAASVANSADSLQEASSSSTSSSLKRLRTSTTTTTESKSSKRLLFGEEDPKIDMSDVGPQDILCKIQTTNRNTASDVLMNEKACVYSVLPDSANVKNAQRMFLDDTYCIDIPEPLNNNASPPPRGVVEEMPKLPRDEKNFFVTSSKEVLDKHYLTKEENEEPDEEFDNMPIPPRAIANVLKGHFASQTTSSRGPVSVRRQTNMEPFVCIGSCAMPISVKNGKVINSISGIPIPRPTKPRLDSDPSEVFSMENMNYETIQRTLAKQKIGPLEKALRQCNKSKIEEIRNVLAHFVNSEVTLRKTSQDIFTHSAFAVAINRLQFRLRYISHYLATKHAQAEPALDSQSIKKTLKIDEHGTMSPKKNHRAKFLLDSVKKSISLQPSPQLPAVKAMS